MIIVDASVTRSIYEEIRKARPDAQRVSDIFPPDTEDAVWLQEAGRNGWLVITRDKKIRKRPGERRAIASSNAGCFVLVFTGNLKTGEIAEMILSHLGKMERLFADTPRPFIYTVTKNGDFRRYEL